jgi:hypothetical protein
MQTINTLLGDIQIIDARTTYNKVAIQINFDGAKDTIVIYPQNKTLISQLHNIGTPYKRALFIAKNFVQDIEKQIDKYMYEA